MIIDITGTVLIPGNQGKDCPGNGLHVNEKGEPIECCCDECDFMLCCFAETDCPNCTDKDCPHSPKAI